MKKIFFFDQGVVETFDPTIPPLQEFFNILYHRIPQGFYQSRNPERDRVGDLPHVCAESVFSKFADRRGAITVSLGRTLCLRSGTASRWAPKLSRPYCS